MKTLGASLAILLAGFAPAAANAAVTYGFSTTEPFAAGTLIAFAYEAPDFLGDTGFIERDALMGATANIQRVRFQASCPFGGGATRCDQVTVIASGSLGGSTSVYRYFADGAFTVSGSATAPGTFPATLTVAPATPAGVPEPATWAMLILGLGATGATLRGRRRGVPAVA